MLQHATAKRLARRYTNATATFPCAAAGAGGRSFMGSIMLELTIRLKLSYQQVVHIIALLLTLFS